MIVYISIYGILAILALATYRNSPTTRVVQLVLFFLTLFAGTRLETGCDFGNYIKKRDFLWEQFGTVPFHEILFAEEPGFLLFSLGTSALGLDIIWLNLAMTIIFFVGLDIFLRRLPNPMAIIALMFPILIVGLVMSGIRQAAATGFLLMALAYYIDKRRVPFVATILLGFTFHASLVIFLPLVFTIGQKLTKPKLLAGVAIGIPIVIFLMDSRLETYQERYLESDLFAGGAIYRAMLISLPGIGFLFLPDRYKFWTEEYDNILKISTYMLIVLLPITVYSSVVGERLGQYFVPMSAIVTVFLSNAFTAKNNSKVPYVLIGILAAYFLYEVSWFSSSFHAEFCYLPYNSYLLPQ